MVGSVRSRGKVQLSESGHKVRESRGLDTGWLSTALREVKSVLSFLVHVRLVREAGFWVLRGGYVRSWGRGELQSVARQGLPC